MRLLFVGSKNLGAIALESLIEAGADICAVVARHDDPSDGMWYRSVSEVALRHDLPLLRPKNINDPEFVSTVRAIGPDRLLSVFHPQIFKRPLLSVAKKGNFNLHFAPLPKYRGCYPGAWAIINGESQHGVTLHHIDPGVDSGAIAVQKMVEIAPDETGLTLYEKCEAAGAELWQEHLDAIMNGDLPREEQDDAHALYYPRGTPFGGIVSWAWDAVFIERYVRALTYAPFRNPISFAGAHEIELKKLMVEAAEGGHGRPGEILSLDPFIVKCGLGAIRIEDYQVNSAKGLAWTPLNVGGDLGR